MFEGIVDDYAAAETSSGAGPPGGSATVGRLAAQVRLDQRSSQVPDGPGDGSPDDPTLDQTRRHTTTRLLSPALWESTGGRCLRGWLLMLADRESNGLFDR